MEPADFKLQKQNVVYECSRFKVEETVFNEEGDTRRTHTIRPSNDFLVIIPRLEDKILLLKEEAPPHPFKQWVFPMGYVTQGIAIADTAQSLLVEKSGTAAQRFIWIGKFFPSNYMNAIAHVMIGEGLHRIKGKSESFKGKVSLFSEKEVGMLLMERAFNDGLALASYVYYVTSEHYWTEVHHGARHSHRSK